MKKFFTIVFLLSNLFANDLTKEQIYKIITAYNIGKNIRAKDGMNFAYTLPAIMGVESSYGKFYVGDKYDKNGKLKSLYLSSLGNFQIKLETARIVIKSTPELSNYMYLVNPLGNKVYKLYETAKRKYKELKKIKSYKKYESYKINQFLKQNKYYKKYIYFKKIYYSKVWNERAKKGSIKAIKTLDWAKRNMDYAKLMYSKQLRQYINQHNFKKEFEKIQIKKRNLKRKIKIYKRYIRKDTLLINKLLGDFEFSATIACYYLRDMYNIALSKHFVNPYRMAVGRYNGGWGNKKYYTKVIRELNFVKKIVKKHQNNLK